MFLLMFLVVVLVCRCRCRLHNVITMNSFKSNLSIINSFPLVNRSMAGRSSTRSKPVDTRYRTLNSQRYALCQTNAARFIIFVYVQTQTHVFDLHADADSSFVFDRNTGNGNVLSVLKIIITKMKSICELLIDKKEGKLNRYSLTRRLERLN